MIVLQNSWLLLALVIVPVIWWLYVDPRRRAAIRFAGVARLPTGESRWRLRARYVLPLLRTLAVAFVVLSVARPQKADEETRITTEGVAIQLVVDRSGSMDQEDFADVGGQMQTRLNAVKDVVQGFVLGDGEELSGRPDDLIGLIAFARYSDTECPLTRDHEHLLRTLKAIKTPPPRSEENFTAIGDALMLAVERIRDISRRHASGDAYKIKSRVIVLLTDGQQNAGKYEPAEAAEVAAALGIKVYTIGAAPEFQEQRMGGLFLQPMVRRVPVEVDEASLQKVAELTGGAYFRAKDADSLREIYAEIDKLERSAVDERRYYEYQELAYNWTRIGEIDLPPPLLVALLLLAAEVLLANTRFRRIP